MYPSVHVLLDGLLSICQTVSMIHVADSQFNGTSTITCTQRNNLLSLEPFSKANRCLFETSKTPHPTLITNKWYQALWRGVWGQRYLKR